MNSAAAGLRYNSLLPSCNTKASTFKNFKGGLHMHTVKEAAMITGLTEHAVRFYTDKGAERTAQ